MAYPAASGCYARAASASDEGVAVAINRDGCHWVAAGGEVDSGGGGLLMPPAVAHARSQKFGACVSLA